MYIIYIWFSAESTLIIHGVHTMCILLHVITFGNIWKILGRPICRVHPNLVMVASTFYIGIGPSNKIR